MGKHATLFALILWRLISVIIIQTAHVPDEYWQSLEVAHKLAFGYGYSTWEWRLGLRNYLYSFFISILYKIIHIFHLDYISVLLLIPKVFQAILTGYADYRLYIWTNKNKWALFCCIFNWYWHYCATRTLINSVETAITTIALSIFSWNYNENTGFLWLVGFLCFARPTAAIIWLPLCLYYLWNQERRYIHVVVKCFFTGAVVLIVSISIDSFLYERFIITPWEFLKFNVILDISKFYGTQSLLWYFYAGLPVVFGLQYLLLPMAIYHICKRYSFYYKQFVLLVVICWTLFIYSMLPHKEFRFILPLLPMLIYITTTVPTFEIPRKFRKLIFALFLLSNLIPGLYFSLIHQRGSLDLMKFLQNQLPKEDSKVDLLFLTPCHASPMYSHLHRNISLRFLTCEPNLNQIENYIDEADQFFIDPMLWLNTTYRNETALPSHLIIFDNIVDKISFFLHKYDKLAIIFYAHFIQGSYGNYIIVYKLKSQKYLVD